MSTRILSPLCLALLLASLVCGCGSGGSKSHVATTGSATRDAPVSLFRQWELVHVSGGIAGGGYTVTPETEFLTFDRNGGFSRVADGKSTQGAYRVTLRSSSLSQGDLPVITYSDTSLAEVVTQVSDQKLALTEDAADGFEREYKPASTAAEAIGTDK